mgnify:CR=1 FL=1
MSVTSARNTALQEFNNSPRSTEAPKIRMPKTNANNKYCDMYTDELRQEVENLYKEDIIYFNY